MPAGFVAWRSLPASGVNEGTAGIEWPAFPFRYKSTHTPVALSEMEEALLVELAKDHQVRGRVQSI